MVQHNQSLCTRPGFGLRFTAETWFLGTAEQPTFAAFKQLEITSALHYSKIRKSAQKRVFLMQFSDFL